MYSWYFPRTATSHCLPLVVPLMGTSGFHAPHGSHRCHTYTAPPFLAPALFSRPRCVSLPGYCMLALPPWVKTSCVEHHHPPRAQTSLCPQSQADATSWNLTLPMLPPSPLSWLLWVRSSSRRDRWDSQEDIDDLEGKVWCSWRAQVKGEHTDCRFLKAQGTRMGTTPRQPRTDCSGAPCHFRAAMAYKNL